MTRVTVFIAATHGRKYALLAFLAELKDYHSGPRRLISVKTLGMGGGWGCVRGLGGDWGRGGGELKVGGEISLWV